MRRINLFDLVELGQGIQEASTVNEKMEPMDALVASIDLRRVLKRIKDDEKIQFGFADHYINELIEAIEGISKRASEKDKDGNPVLTLGWAANHRLRRKIEEFRTVLAAEFRSSATYFVAKVGIYSTNDLIENASSKFSSDTLSNISTDGLGQFQEAARCLSFGLYTACGFHMMRAVEYILLELMRLVCGKGFNSLNANWGAYIAELEKIASGKGRRKPTAETIDLLRQIKNNHRNPVMHAEISLSQQEAMDVFDLGAVVMSHISEELRRLR